MIKLRDRKFYLEKQGPPLINCDEYVIENISRSFWINNIHLFKLDIKFSLSAMYNGNSFLAVSISHQLI